MLAFYGNITVLYYKQIIDEKMLDTRTRVQTDHQKYRVPNKN